MVEVVNLRTCNDWGKPGDVRIDRTTKWGNPFVMNHENERVDVIIKYEEHFIENLLKDIGELSDAKRLGCWCKPKQCHGDVIKRYLEDKYIICTHCRSKGIKKPHFRIRGTFVAKNYGWYDYRCGSCGEAFRSYDRDRYKK